MRDRHQSPWNLDLGALVRDSSRIRFRVWAPHAKRVSLRIVGPAPAVIPMEPAGLGYHEVLAEGIEPGARYLYVLDERKERPDPASRWQPDGVHQPSAIVDPSAFQWTDHGWLGIPLKDLIIYELHVGTFTKEGTFEAIIPLLEYLKHAVGVTALELMPVAQFPGRRNWGYDGVYPFAPQASYGGPEGLKQLVDACHAQGLAVILDVVYNHLGPEGNYLGDFGPYFTDRYRTPWGSAINYDGPHSDEVRHYVISNAVYWIAEYHFDGLRLDAIHGIFDSSARHILRDLNEAAHAEADRLGRTVAVIAESDLNDVRIIAPTTEGGYGLDGQWNDDFHHALHALLTGERSGYYQDFGRLDQLAGALQDGFVYSGQPSAYRRRRHGNSSKGRPPAQFIVCGQNHDQVGNRTFGDRLSALAPVEALKVAAAAVLLAPNVPLLFMGEEYGETAPFQYFIDHGDRGLVEAVRKGRRAEFARFGWEEQIPDPHDPATFERCRVQPGPQSDPGRAALLRWHHALIHLRRTVRCLGAAESEAGRPRVRTLETEQVLVVHRRHEAGGGALVVLGFNPFTVKVQLHEWAGRWTLALASSEPEFGGAGLSGIPQEFNLRGEGVRLELPRYFAGVYLSRT